MPIFASMLLTIASGIATAGTPSGDRGEPPGVVSSASAGAGSFAFSSDAGALVAVASGDGARMVVQGAVLVIAGDGARLRIRTTDTTPVAPPVIEPLDGPLRVLSGSGGARLEFNGSAFDLVRAEVLLARQNGAWALEVVAVADGGQVTLQPPAPTDAVAPTDAPPGPVASSTPASPPGPVAPGEILLLAPRAVPERAPPTRTVMLASAAGRLIALPAAPSGSRLLSIAVEDPSDFIASRGRGDTSGASIDIEAVEVEIGCVEVCVD
jgi:hypothetical protein